MAKLKNEVSLDDNGSVTSGGSKPSVPAKSKSKKTLWVLLALALAALGVTWVSQQDDAAVAEGEVTVEEVVEDAAEAVETTDETADAVGEVTEETSEEVK